MADALPGPIERAWRRFAGKRFFAYSPKLDEEMRAAFFAGATACRTLVDEHLATEGPPTDAEVAFVDALDAELADFVIAAREMRA